MEYDSDSEFKKRGELLPYYYYLKYKWFDCAVIIHDSCFINKKLNIEIEDYISLMHFVKHSHDNIYNETRIIKSLNNYNGLLLPAAARTASTPVLFFERKTMRNHELRSFGRYREERRICFTF